MVHGVSCGHFERVCAASPQQPVQSCPEPDCPADAAGPCHAGSLAQGSQGTPGRHAAGTTDCEWGDSPSDRQKKAYSHHQTGPAGHPDPG
eukprot:7763176-Prorocentrum_lima.AAC.1